MFVQHLFLELNFAHLEVNKGVSFDFICVYRLRAEMTSYRQKALRRHSWFRESFLCCLRLHCIHPWLPRRDEQTCPMSDARHTFVKLPTRKGQDQQSRHLNEANWIWLTLVEEICLGPQDFRPLFRSHDREHCTDLHVRRATAQYGTGQVLLKKKTSLTT